MNASNQWLMCFQPQDDPKRRPVCRVGRLATWLLVGVLIFGSTAQPVGASLWDDFRDGVKELYTVFQLGEVDEASIPQMPVRYAGKVGLIFQGQVELAFDDDTPGIGDVDWMGITPEGTLLITDQIGHQALEFSLHDGRYIRHFGRRGNGPGEYRIPYSMAVDPKGQVYLSGGNIIRYDRQGQHLDHTRALKTPRVLTGRGGELFFLKSNVRKIFELQRRDPVSWAVVYRTPLSTDKQQFISYRMPFAAQLCYSVARHRLYYLGPNDYRVKEIDADTGQVIRQFGDKPEGFVPLPKRYHDIGKGSVKDMSELQMSRVRSITLLQDRYLLISFYIDLQSSWEQIVYDLDSVPKISTYDFDRRGIELFDSFSSNISPWNSITAWQDILYIWKAPSTEVAETSNGIVQFYKLSFLVN